MKKYIISIIVLLIGLSNVQSQETAKTEKEKAIPVIAPFESGILIDNQTGVIPPAKTLEFLIQHHFGTVENGMKDIYGIYSSANVRLGLNYSILNNVMVGYGLTRNKMYSDFQAKWNVVQQTRKNEIPVAVTLYGNMAIDGRAKTVFEGATGADSAYSFGNRIAYFGQVIVGRKFNDALTLQVHGCFTHYNKVQSKYDHDNIGIGINGRIKFSPQSSFLFQYDYPLKIKNISEHIGFDNPSLPALAFGYEVSTGTHVFQIYIANTNGIIPQENYMFNESDLKFISNWRLGFTITRLWGF